MKHWNMSPEDKADWITEDWRAAEMTCRLCRRGVPRRGMVSDHGHLSGMTRAALCIRCNGYLGSMETAGKTDGEMRTLMASKGLRGPNVGSTLLRMRSYLVYFGLLEAEFVSMLKANGIENPKAGSLGLEAEIAWARASTKTMLQYKKWLRRKFGRGYTAACWFDNKTHTHRTARSGRARIAELMATRAE
jgi:hypothetical protein